MSGKAKTRLAVIGPGHYFKKLLPGLNKQFELVSLLGEGFPTSNAEALDEALGKNQAEAVMILTPNGFHSQIACMCLDLGYPTFVEKPLATTSSGLNNVLLRVRSHPRLYCSDFYPDVRAVPLRLFFGASIPWLEDRIQVEGDQSLWVLGAEAIGHVHEIEAVLMEGEGEARGFEAREWLWDPIHGGVVWDLAYHYLTLWHFLFGGPLSLSEAHAGIIGNAPISKPAETQAKLSFVSKTGRRLVLHVMKYHSGPNERFFKVKGSLGEAKMVFSDQNILTVLAKDKSCCCILMDDYHALVSEAFGRWLLSSPSHPYGLDAAKFAVSTALEAKATLGTLQVNYE